MSQVRFFDLLSRIESGKGQYPLIVAYGFNEFLGEKIAAALSRSFLEQKDDFNFHRYYFDGEDRDTWESVIAEANSSSFFMQSRKILVAVIRDGKQITLNKSDKALLKKYLQGPTADTVLLVFVSLDLNKDDYKQIKKQKIDKLVKDLASPHTVHVDLDAIGEEEIKRYAGQTLAADGITITRAGLDRLVEIKGDDFISIIHQLPKLTVAPLKEKRLDADDIDKIVTGVEAHSIWDLTDAIEREDTVTYLKVLRYLFIDGIKPTIVIGTLITYYNKIYTAKFLLKKRLPVAEIGKALQQHPYYLNKFMTAVRRIPDGKLRHILDVVYQLDYRQKSGGEDAARLALQGFIFQVKTRRR